MPPMELKENDAYICTSIKLPQRSLKLTSVIPRSEQNIVHHMLLYGCHNPAGVDQPWHCMGGICKDDDVVLYGWGRNADPVIYPEGVAFSLGEGTGITSLVLQIHYLSGRPTDDTSGVTLHLSDEPSEKTASVIMYASGFTIPPGKDVHPVRNKCCYSGFEPIHTVAFRVHTHALGRNVYMKKFFEEDSEGRVIAERNPLLPQGFVPVNSTTRVHPGERLEVSCDFDSSKKTSAVHAGATHEDEMCNMYMIVYSDIPYFSLCTNSQGFYAGKNGGSLDEESEFQDETNLSDLWQDPKDEINVGQAVGVARGHDGRIWYLHRGDHVMQNVEVSGKLYTTDKSLIPSQTVLLLNPQTGNVEVAWGSNFFNTPHMLTVASDDSVWITDVGKHQVYKFSPEGKLLMTLGEEFTPGNEKHQFCAPTQAITLSDGSILVSDGYCNHRVVKFNSKGEFVNELVDPLLKLPHSLIADECNDLLYVADREGQQVAYYSLSTMDQRKGVMDIEGEQVMALARGPHNYFLALAWTADNNATVYQFLSSDNTPELTAEWEISSSAFPHDLALSSAPLELTGAGDRLHALYVAETDSHELKKFILVPKDFKPVEVPQKNKEIEDGYQSIKDFINKHGNKLQERKVENVLNSSSEAASLSNSSFLRLLSFLLPFVALILAFLYFKKSKRKTVHLSHIRTKR